MTRIAKKFDKIAFVASEVPEARAALERLAKDYGNAEARRPMPSWRSAATG